MKVNEVVSEGSESNDQSWTLPQLWAVFLLLLIAVTYRLWCPHSDIPAIPLFGIGRLPIFVQWIPVSVLVIATLSVAIFPVRLRPLWWLVWLALVAAFLLDQHRLQPWAYQSAIYATVFASMNPVAARRWLIPLAASVYIYSAAGKFDFQFVHTVGHDFVTNVAAWFGANPDDVDHEFRARLALILPASELTIGLALLWRRARPIAGIFAIAMHISLVAVLGPWAMNHSNGVVVWNLLLIAQAWILFVHPGWPPSVESEQNDLAAADRSMKSERSPRVGTALASIVVAVAIVAPLFERAGYWDHWLSWALYSPHTSRAEVLISRPAIDKLPESMRAFVFADDDNDGWHELSLDCWSLETLGVPVYPQARYQLALAVKVSREHDLNQGIGARVRGVSDRWTGQRIEHLLLWRDEMEKGLKQYWLVE